MKKDRGPFHLIVVGESDPDLRDILRDSQNRVRSMALIHQTLYQSRDFRRVDFEAFLRGLVPMLVAAHAPEPERIRLELAADTVRLPINTVGIRCQCL